MRAADFASLRSLAADATVSRANLATSVMHPAPSPAGHVPGASTQGHRPASHPSAQSHSSKAFAVPRFDRTTSHHFVPSHLVLAHLARTRPGVLGLPWRSSAPGGSKHIRAAALQPCQSTGAIEMPSITAHRLLGTPQASPLPMHATRALVACPRARPLAGAIAASTRTANPACSGLAQLRCARH
jgi:hypothetical protein